MKVLIKTLGCEKNTVDSENAMALLAQTGCTEEFLATSARAKRELLSVKYSKQLKWDNVL